MNLNGKKVVECAGVALVNGGRVFLIRPLFNGIVQQFGLPKGHVEYNETPQYAAIREFNEETGIDISNKKLEFIGYAYSTIDSDTIKKVIVYKADGDGDEVFKCSNLSSNGEPENVGGCYIPYERAYELITVYQQPIIKKLMHKELFSFKKFFSNFFSNGEK